MAYQNEIEKIDDTDAKRAEIEEECVTAKTVLLSKLDKAKPVNLNDSYGNNTTVIPFQSQSVNKLPPIKIPKFSGKYNEYNNFMSCFNHFVHNDQNLTNTEKLNYLLSSLSDEELRTVKAFQVSDENFELALERLKERYDNKCLIFKHLISSLFELPKMNKPSASELRQIVDNVSAIIDSISTLGKSENITHSIIIHLVLSKIYASSNEKWDEQLNYKSLPSWKDCSEVLIKRCQFLEMNGKTSCEDNMQFGKSKQNIINTKSSFVSSVSQVKPCVFCSENNHAIYRCPKFQDLTPQARYMEIKRLQLCVNCLKSGHNTRSCSSSACRPNITHYCIWDQATLQLIQWLPILQESSGRYPSLPQLPARITRSQLGTAIAHLEDPAVTPL